MEEKDIDRIIEMAWEDRTPFEAIKLQFAFSEADVIWQIQERNKSFYYLNTLYCSLVINSLILLLNKNSRLILTNEKSYRKLTGRKNLYSWSIAVSDQTVIPFCKMINTKSLFIPFNLLWIR